MPAGPMQFGAINDAGGDKTTLLSSNADETLLVENTADLASGITVNGFNIGVRATADPNAEVSNGVDARGRTAVYAAGSSEGVLGDSLSTRGGQGNGVVGRSDLGNRSGVAGQHLGTGSGVSGFCNEGLGVFGQGRTGFGVFGVSISSVGVAGDSTSSTAVQGTTATGFAGAFFGRTAVVGNLSVDGNLSVTGLKSMAMAQPDGSYRRLYTLESPESWFEDFGRAEIAEGRARVEVDPDYAALVRLNDYHVFLTPEGDSNGLYVASMDSTGFEVREQQRGMSRLTFSYRVIARRKDIQGERLERVDEPRPIRYEPIPFTAELPEVPNP